MWVAQFVGREVALAGTQPHPCSCLPPAHTLQTLLPGLQVDRAPAVQMRAGAELGFLCQRKKARDGGSGRSLSPAGSWPRFLGLFLGLVVL